jgi:cellulose synthase/poly-beta-1,6-N-acetylglucosamine synthase-like glycosyltransferase
MILNFKILFLLNRKVIVFNKDFVIVQTKTQLWAASLCHSLVRHTFIQHLMAAFFFIAIIFLVLYISLIIYYRFAFTSIPTINQSTNQPINNSTKLSIIIPARNEEANIENCLQSILQNNYPAHLFEIIVVDDHSEDNTANIVKKYAPQNVKLILLKDFVADKINSYKKKAVEIAIAQASGTLIITTDADCIVPATWLQTIATFYEEKKPAFIAAPVLIDSSYFSQTHTHNENAKGSELSHPSPPRGEGQGLRAWGVRLFQSLDFMALQGITAAVVNKKQMTMCNGANMAYERAAFYEVGGFAGIDNIASGDDMLLMHKIYKQYPDRVLFLKSKNAIVKTAPVNTIKQFFNQRIRWASKAEKYDDKRILPVLVLVYFFNCFMLALPIVAIFNNAQYSMFNVQCSMLGLWLWMLLLKIVVELFFLFPVASFFGKKSMLWFFPFLQPFHICYTIIAGWLGKFAKYTWKEREVN